jgi:ribosomal protein S20
VGWDFFWTFKINVSSDWIAINCEAIAKRLEQSEYKQLHSKCQQDNRKTFVKVVQSDSKENTIICKAIASGSSSPKRFQSNAKQLQDACKGIIKQLQKQPLVDCKATASRLQSNR